MRIWEEVFRKCSEKANVTLFIQDVDKDFQPYCFILYKLAVVLIVRFMLVGWLGKAVGVAEAIFAVMCAFLILVLLE